MLDAVPRIDDVLVHNVKARLTHSASQPFVSLTTDEANASSVSQQDSPREHLSQSRIATQEESKDRGQDER
jgi:hypothetical protein